jgi:ring-1,2-phenylacetyl-CoA epoxidase subunit PaaB
MDQLGTFEVFVQPKDGKPFQHEGAVHAPDPEIAYVLAKETFTRRFLCTSLWVVETASVFVTPTTEGSKSVYDLLQPAENKLSPLRGFEIFHLAKRGKQHIHFKTVEASGADEALWEAKKSILPGNIFFNIWVIESGQIRKTHPEEKDLWITLPDKTFRDAAAYKGGDKLKNFLEKNPLSNT